MEIVSIIIAFAFGVLLIDYCLYGLFPSKFGLMPRISDLGDGDRLIDDHQCRAHTNFEGKFIASRINNRRGYLAVALTKSHFFVRANRLNYLFKVDVSSIDHYEVKRGIRSRHIRLLCRSNGEVKFVSIYSSNLEKWIESLNAAGVMQLNETAA